MAKPLAFEVDNTQTAALNYFLPIMKIDKDKRTVTGYASTEAKDSDGEIVKLDAVKAALPDYMKWGNIREMHGLSAVGTAEEANFDRKGLLLTAKISDDRAWQKVVDNVYKGFSVGGRVKSRDPSNNHIITAIGMTEISLVDRPSNPECKFKTAIAKREKDTEPFVFTEGFELRKNKAKLNKAARLSKDFSLVSEFLLKAAEPFEKPTDQLNSDHATIGEKCEKHGVENCEKCAAKVAKKVAKLAKRKFTEEQRKNEAKSGNAMADGSFPIENQKDLDNAVGLRGNSKHSKSEVEAHIRAMAAKHGLKLPESMGEKVEKAVDGLSTRQIQALFGLSAMPPFLTLGAEEGDFSESLSKGFGTVSHDTLPSGLGLESKPRKGGSSLKKSMNTAGSLSYCFDSIREAQRRLMMEAKREGGDRKDAKLAKELGSVAQTLAAVIGQKAEHEGQEALDLSDADDLYVVELLGEDFAMAQQNGDLSKMTVNMALENLVKRASQPTRAQRMEMCKGAMKKANKTRKEARDSIEEAHKICKAAYLSKMQKAAKTAKKPEDNDDDFDMEKVMSSLSKAYSDLGKVGTFMKAAKGQLEKVARSGQRGQEAGDSEPGFFEPMPTVVKPLQPNALAAAGPGSTARGSMPPEQMLDENWANKLAKAVGNQPVTPELIALVQENARLSAQAEFYGNLPSNGSRPFTMDMTKFANGTYGDHGNRPAMGFGGQEPSGDQRLAKAVRDSGVNPRAVIGNWSESGKVIGTYMLDAANGKSLFDPQFRGGAGGRS